MKYERLTDNKHKGYLIGCQVELQGKGGNIDGCYGECGDCDICEKALYRLAELENKIENGTLVELPCKVGDKVWVIAKQGMDIYTVEETTIVDFWFYPNKNRFYPIDANEIPLEKVFLTKDEAEKRLKELEANDDERKDN